MPDLGLRFQGLVAGAAHRLRLAGMAEPRREAMRIWAGLSGEDTVLWGDRIVDAEDASSFQRAIERRVEGEPLAHVTGSAGFRHLSLRSDGRALIPRPETEGLVELLLQRVRSGVVADIGTGSGCIALSLATEGGFSEIVAVDRSADALALAGENRELVGAGSLRLVQADLCEPLRPASLDALISNPPYLTTSEYVALDRSVRDWEPDLALVGGEDGLGPTVRLLDDARGVVRPGGWLFLEVDSSRAGRAALCAHQLGWQDVTVHVDLFGRERYLLARRSDTR
jgi:release factor glutamine methyltransferase